MRLTVLHLVGGGGGGVAGGGLYTRSTGNKGECRKRTGNYSAFKMAAGASKKMDETLDFLSPKFDPLKALYAADLEPPVPKIQIFNNVAEYALAIKEGKTKSSEVVKPRRTTDSRQAVSRTKNLKPEYKPVQEDDLQERLKAIAESKAGNIEDTNSVKKSDVRMDDSKLQEFILAEEAFKAEQKRKKRMDVIQRMDGKSRQYENFSFLSFLLPVQYISVKFLQWCTNVVQ